MITESKEWDGIERRRTEAPKPGMNGGTSDAAFLQYIVNQLDALNAKMDAMHGDHVRQAAAIAGLESAIPKAPDGGPDYDGHHDYHYRLIESSKSWRDIWQDVKKKLFGGIAWATVAFCAYALWEAIKQEIKK